ncbi:MAG: ABC transporter ATP-binding protein [Cytophagales bacterium]|nr:ABC transporter ATP-binding protein [Cytophagales bacterium]
MSNKAPTVLETHSLQVGFRNRAGDKVLFEPLSLALNRGELVCFMGLNGAGKTTLIKTLAGIHPPLEGVVTTTQSVAIVLTEKITGTQMTVRDLVTYGRYPYLDWWLTLSAHDQAIIERAIQQVNLSAIADNQLSQVSDGQLQMALIAKALAQDAAILLLDEPTAHLDLNNRVEIMNLLRNLAHRAGKTILVATHELDLALQTADKIWLATPNKKIITGVPEDLVLDGSFDSVFQLKGFDLKTGKITHQAYRPLSIALEGSSHEFLWTKNALERCGYKISSESSLHLAVGINKEQLHFTISAHEATHTVSTLKELLEYLAKVDQ